MTPDAIRTPTRLDLTMMIVTALIWASGFVAIRVAVPETGPVWLAAIRVGLGFLVLLPYAIWRGMVWPQGSGQWRLIIGMSLLNVVVPFMLISWAGLRLEASVLSLLMGTGPFLALIGSHFLTHDDRLTIRKFFSVFLGFAGILVLVGPSAVAGLGGGSFQAKLAALGATVCYVVAGLLIRRISMPPVRLACLALAIGSAALVPLALVIEGPPAIGLSTPAVAALIYLGLFPTGIAYILRFHLIRTIGYSRFALTINLIPVFGVTLGIVLLGEPLSLNVGIALALVLCGLYIAGGRDKTQSGAHS
jgi:drug/metabolite transporter (DMT)-like permease